MCEQPTGIVRRHGKPFDYFRLGKSFREGAAFMQHMKSAAEQILGDALACGRTRSVTTCPVCGGSETRERLRFCGFPYRQCEASSCRHAFVATLVDDELRGRFFREDAEYSRRNYCDPKRSSFRIENIAKPKVEHVLSFVRPQANRWLDVGCGSGEVLAALRSHGSWQAVGLELSNRDAAFGREQLGVDVREQLLGDYLAANPGVLFDVVSLFGVLHCVEDTVGLLREAAGAVAPGGLLVAEVTNFESIVARAVQAFPDHPTRSSFNGVTTLHQFTQASILHAFRLTGLDAISVWFYGTDAFEVVNQWCFSDPAFPGSPLEEALSELANDIQAAIDQREQGSHMLWTAAKAEV
jgi:SAM-dependent methyltransferase